MKRMIHRKRSLAVILAVLLAAGAFAEAKPSTRGYAAESASTEREHNGEAETDTDVPVTEPAGEEPALTEAPEPTTSEDMTPTVFPTQDPEVSGMPTATPAPEEEPTIAPSPTEAPELTTEPTPTPTKKPKPTATPTPTKKPKPTATPKPTKKPKPTATPEPTTSEDVTPTVFPTQDPEVSGTPTPTPTPTPAVSLPTESNEARYQYLLGMEPREITMDTPPEGFETKEAAEANMTTITVPVWKMKANGERYESTYKLVIHKKLAKSVKAIFKEIFALDIKFPIKYMNGFAYRKVGGVGLTRSTLMSVHSFGAAIDINPGDYDNDYFLGKGNDLRDKSNPYCIPDEVIEIFKRYGWFWGGEVEICADTMHFQYLGLEMLHYQGNSPFRTVKVKQSFMTGSDVRNLQQRLCELGFHVTVDGVYGNRTAAAVKKFQARKGLPANGVVDYKTWETIINETHYMAYVF